MSEGKNSVLAELKVNLIIDSRTTIEHIGQFIVRCREASNGNSFRLELFSLSLPGITFMRFTLLVPNSIHAWLQIGNKLHDYFRIKDIRSKRGKVEKTDIKEIDYVSKISDKASTKKCIAEWVDIKSEPFVCLALEPCPQKNRLKKKKYTFSMTKCD